MGWRPYPSSPTWAPPHPPHTLPPSHPPTHLAMLDHACVCPGHNGLLDRHACYSLLAHVELKDKEGRGAQGQSTHLQRQAELGKLQVVILCRRGGRAGNAD